MGSVVEATARLSHGESIDENEQPSLVAGTFLNSLKNMIHVSSG